MRVSRFRVAGLFDRFDHDLIFPEDERIAIISAPNGFGKTMILRIIHTLFNRPAQALASLPFGQIQIAFDDGSSLSVLRSPAADSEEPTTNGFGVRLTFTAPGGEAETFRPRELQEEELGFPLAMIEEWIATLERIGRTTWRDSSTGEMVSLEWVIDRYGDYLPIDVESTAQSPSWLTHMRESIPVRLIDTERLVRRHPATTQRYRSPRSQPTYQRTVRTYSQQLGALVRDTLSEYGTLSQRLDRTFPARLVSADRSDLTIGDLKYELADVEAKRQKLIEAGLLGEEPEAWGVPPLDIDKADGSQRGVLAVFAKDAKEKLGVFDRVLAKVETMTRIANARFLHKQVTISQDGIAVITPEGVSLHLEMLSSGEQHELVLLFDLLFRVPENSWILIDEPELSLHVAWQEELLADIDEMARISGFRALLATHSPQIIGDRYDLTIELKSPK